MLKTASFFKEEQDPFYKRGQVKGLRKGIEKGIEKERARAFAEKLKSASGFKKMGLPIADIAKGLQLSIEEVEKL